MAFFARRLWLILLAAVLWHRAACGLFGDDAPRAVDHLLLLNGDDVAAAIDAIDGQGRIAAAGLSVPLDLQSLRRIDRGPGDVRRMPRFSPVQVYLNGGGLLQADQAIIQDESCTVDWTHGKGLSLPIEMVRGVRLSASAGPRLKGKEDFEKALAETAQQHDQLFVIVADAVQVISGVFEELTADEVRFQWKEMHQSVPRAKVYALAIAPVGKPADRSGQCLVALDDGSALAGRVLKLEAGELALEPAPRVEVSLPWQSVASLTIFNARLAFCSDLEPVEVVQEPLVTLPAAWQRDRSVQGRPLTLGNKVFAKGLGVHSRCLLTFANDRFDAFAATLGIDAETAGKGDCIFQVLGDGRELLKRRVRGGDPPFDARVKIAGVKRITLAVEPGEDLDLADHADWCDARFIREKSAPAARSAE